MGTVQASAGICGYCRSETGTQQSAVIEPVDEQDVLTSLEACCEPGGTALDYEQLKLALNTQGLYPSTKELQQVLMAAGLEVPIRFEVFMKLKGVLLDTNCRRGLKVVPHARRGVSLQQLQKLHAAFVESGWLQEQCRAFNSANTGDTSKNAFFMTENLYAIDKLVIQPVTGTDGDLRKAMSGAMLLDGGIPGVPADPCSFSQLVNPRGAVVDFFVSHYWGHAFPKTLTALTGTAAEAYPKLGKDGQEHVVFWICAFALNQHRVAEELGVSPEQGPFNAALRWAGAGAILVVDKEAEPFKRIWCLFEVQRVHELGQPLQLVTDEGMLGNAITGTSIKVADKLAQLSAFDASSSSEDDRIAILYRIVDGTRKFAGFEEFKASFYASGAGNTGKVVQTSHFTNFEFMVRRILATPLFGIALRSGDMELSMKYIAQGAVCTVSDLQALADAGADLSSSQSVKFMGYDSSMPLIYFVAQAGWVDELRFLLDHGVDIDSQVKIPDAPRSTHAFMNNCSTPLVRAVWTGLLPIVSLLLEKQANPEGGTVGAAAITPLHVVSFASLSGVSGTVAGEIGALLLESKANVNACAYNGCRPLHMNSAAGAIDGANGDNDHITPALLSHGADPFVVDEDGSSPLHYAAFWSNVKAISLLVKSGVDLNVRRTVDGMTPLHRAARNGKCASLSMLLQLKADAQVTDNAGKTPAQIAADFEHADALQLLESSQSMPQP